MLTRFFLVKINYNFQDPSIHVCLFCVLGYGNIAPKTPWGRIVTIIYAVFGMPLFLMWASQMGSFMAQSFQFLYSNVCCALCKRGKKRRAEAAARLRKERRIHERYAHQKMTEDIESA